MRFILSLSLIVCSHFANASINNSAVKNEGFVYTKPNLKKIEATPIQKPQKSAALSGQYLVFDLPITYNDKVKYWINYFQTSGKKSFSTWLERSQRYIPRIQAVFKEKVYRQILPILP